MSEGTLNEVKLLGRLGKDPDLRTMPSGDSVCNIILATNETYKDKRNDKLEKHTQWHTVSFFGKRAENVGKYCHKGSRVFIEGRLHTIKWKDEQGSERYKTEIHGFNIIFLDTQKGGNDGE